MFQTTVCFIPWTHQHIIEMRSVLLITLPVALIIFINLTSANDSQDENNESSVIKAFQIKSVLMNKMSSSLAPRLGSYRLCISKALNWVLSLRECSDREEKGEEEVQLIRALDYDCHSGGSAVQCWFEALWVLG